MKSSRLPRRLPYIYRAQWLYVYYTLTDLKYSHLYFHSLGLISYVHTGLYGYSIPNVFEKPQKENIIMKKGKHTLRLQHIYLFICVRARSSIRGF